ncbi:MAG: tetratricopeptide repeat protein [Candidatus Atribacteria bacterium]|nr:MAG: tetratricopeptide repeat protein [Candidatus Atribacteria bacterium]
MEKKQKGLASMMLLALSVAISSCFWLQGCAGSVNSRNVNKYNSSDNVSDFDKGANQPPSVKTLYSLADILTKQGKNEQAEIVLKKIIKEHPEFLPAWNSLAESQMRQGRIDEAINTLSTALKIIPKDPVLLNNRGMCFMIRQDYNKALEMFAAAAGVKPENARYRANMAVSLVFLGRDDEAMSLYRQILPEDQAKHNLNIIRTAREKRAEESLMPVEDTEKK